MYPGNINQPEQTLMKARGWVVVLSNTEARIYEQVDGETTLRLLRKIKHSDGRLRNQELKEGRPGRAFSSWLGSFSSHAMNTEVSPHEKAAWDFCRAVAKVLGAGRIDNRFSSLTLVAEPHFLGKILANLDRSTRRMVVNRIAKDLTNLSDKEVSDYICGQEIGRSEGDRSHETGQPST